MTAFTATGEPCAPRRAVTIATSMQRSKAMHSEALRSALAAALLALAGAAAATPEHYVIDPDHTYPSFEADHMGISVWRGKFNHTTGEVTLDRAAGSGTVDIDVDVTSMDFGNEPLYEKLGGPALFDTQRYPQAHYRGRLEDFHDGAPSRVVGELTLHGVTRPVALRIDEFKCIPHPMLKRELCGADALGSFQRDAFGLDFGKDYGFDMKVTLRIQVEALRAE
jgi:polyisoprenoid-binding protein YceI